MAWHFIKPALESENIKVEKRERDESGKIINTPSIGSIIEPQKKLSRSSQIKPLLLETYYEDLPHKIADEVQETLKTHQESSIGILVHPQAKDLKKEISKELRTLNITHHAPENYRDRDGNVVSRSYIIYATFRLI